MEFVGEPDCIVGVCVGIGRVPNGLLSVGCVMVAPDQVCWAEYNEHCFLM